MGVLYDVRYAHSASGSLCAQSFPSGRIIFLRIVLTSRLLTSTCTFAWGVVWRGDAVVYSIFFQQRPEVRVVEV